MSPGSRWPSAARLAIEWSARGTLALAILGVSLAASQARDRRFIVAFELRVDTRQEFVWPHPTFPGAAYERVLLAVDEMPRVRSSDGQLEALRAAGHLRINGRLAEAPNDTGRVPATNQKTRPEEFVVKLDAGRLRVSLVLPPRVDIDPRYRSVRITVYEVEQPPDTSPPTEDVAGRE